MALASGAHARTRPRYGGALRAQTQAIAMSGDYTPEVLVGPVFETLVTVDDNGHLKPGLAISWTSSNNGRRWEFTLRPGVTFHDGQPCDSPAIELSLSMMSGFPWRAHATARGLVIESDEPQPNLPALLSLQRYAIFATQPNDHPVGTGPFEIENRTAAAFSLSANDKYWGGRPFVDRLEITTSRNSRDQMSDFTLDRADVIEITPEQWRRAQQDHLRTSLSRPSQTVFVVMDSSRPGLQDVRLRQAIALSIDRYAIHNVIFQRQGEISASLLPNWLTGYAFLFDPRQDIVRARQLRNEVGQAPPLAIAYDAGDQLQRLIAERIALNVQDIGISMQAVPNTASRIDLRIRVINLPSLDPAAALSGIADQLGLTLPSIGASPESLYNSERAALQTYMAIPLVTVPRATALKDRVRNWTESPEGNRRFANVWLAPRTRPEVRP
ncbi:MAG TPA: ABC transporter substrate-binding protein [Terriglobales bacterium]|nr:ABC transporter substrate-binding protein [Terriglobales bacterium]